MAGLRVNDVIIQFGGQKINNVADLVRAIRTAEIGEEVEIVFVRGEDTRTTSAKLIERPSP
jgi:S1-C subfamily serine protease